MEFYILLPAHYESLCGRRYSETQLPTHPLKERGRKKKLVQRKGAATRSEQRAMEEDRICLSASHSLLNHLHVTFFPTILQARYLLLPVFSALEY